MDREWTRSELNLFLKGSKQGFLTYREINDHLSEDVYAPDQIEAIVNMIKDAGILVYDDHKTPKDRIVPWRKAKVRRTVQQFFGTPAPDIGGGLTPLEARVLRMRFGIGMDTHYTLEESAKQLDFPHERIRQIETKALSKLREPVNFASVEEAVKWLHRAAAEHGDAQAQSDLGFMYENGTGVGQDYIRSHAWYNLAGSQGEDMARRNCDKVAKQMTPDQIAEAQALAKKWAAEYNKE